MIWSDIAAAAATLFFVMDPLGNIPVFNAVLSRFTPQRRAQITARELVIALVILLIFLFAGTAILEFLGLSQPSLSIAGGVLLFIIALRMIFPHAAGEVASDREEPLIVPLAMPMVAGPSTIAILLLLSSTAPERIWEWCTALVLAWAVTTVLLTASPFLLRVLGDRGLRALERLMGMLLVLLATQMLLDGVREFVQSLDA
ncbi:MAG: YhgN family NAAT transporter [Lysobacterales bacterium]|nr:MAG: YhgN family NAAT transporter [Xanthomonadales bacterium]